MKKPTPNLLCTTLPAKYFQPYSRPYYPPNNRFGLAMDNIVSIEVVTLTGDILTANADQHSEIFRALKGGGNNFGIVTKWTIKTHHQTAIWFQRYPYENNQFPEVQAAVLGFAAEVDNDRKGYLENKFEWTCEEGQLKASAYAVCFYDGPSDSVPQIFEEFHRLSGYFDKETQNHKTYIELMENLQKPRQTLPGVVEGVEAHSRRGRYACVMLSRYTEVLIKKIVDVIEKAAQDLLDHSGLQLYTNLKVISKHIFEGVTANSSAWPHEEGSPNFPLPICCKWTNANDDRFWIDKLQAITEEIRTYAIAESCSTDEAPIYPGLALDGTKSEDIYRDNITWLRALRSHYDPNNLIELTGGFRV